MKALESAFPWEFEAARSPPKGVEFMPPKPREGAEEALEITFVVKPENVGAVEDAPIPNPPVDPNPNGAADVVVEVLGAPKPNDDCCCWIVDPKPKEGAVDDIVPS